MLSISTEFQRVFPVTSDYTVTIIAAIILGICIIGGIIFAVKLARKLKQNPNAPATLAVFAFGGTMMGLLVLMGVHGTNTFLVYENLHENLNINLKTVYEYDSITYGEKIAGEDTKSVGDNKVAVSVTKGEKVYRAYLTVNPDTYEPTLHSYETEEGIEELKRK